MILKTITPKFIGPFVGDTTLQLEDDVTVLTGSNDVGKSLALRAIEILCTSGSVKEHEVNRYHSEESRRKWNEDPDIKVDAVFEYTTADTGQKGFPRDWNPGTRVTVQKSPSTDPAKGEIKLVEANGQRVNPSSSLSKFPDVIWLPKRSQIRPVIDINTWSDAERELLQLGFGEKFNPEQNSAWTDSTRRNKARDAESRLSERLLRIWPNSMRAEFQLIPGAKPELFQISLLDKHRGSSPLETRGHGLQRIVQIMGALLRIDPATGHSIVLFDEPETSLHADAQHTLRRLLEELGAHQTIQVVYTTHSPSMINSFRPRCLRMVESYKNGDRAVSRFVNDAYRSNFTKVRSSLGITPADSLLYSPITVIVEGPTEVRCLPLMFQKLVDANLLDRGDMERLLPLVHLLDGEGDKYEYMCRLAKSQKASVILFLDSDKKGTSKVEQVAANHDDVDVIFTADGTEFEDLLPKSRYMQAIADWQTDTSERFSESAFAAWERQHNNNPNKMFSKRIEDWLKSLSVEKLNKPIVMELAAEQTPAEEISIEPLRQLIAAMKRIAESL